jgi:hypothetical protein
MRNIEIKAKLRAIEDKKVVLLATSDGKEENYLEYALPNSLLMEKKINYLFLN